MIRSDFDCLNKMELNFYVQVQNYEESVRNQHVFQKY